MPRAAAWTPPLGGPIPKVDPGYEDLSGLYPHDVAKAKKLMEQAGYSESKPLDLTLTYATCTAPSSRPAQEPAQAIGID